MKPLIAFLHTSPVHVATFDALVLAMAPGTRVSHVVREDLLADAQLPDVDNLALAARVASAMRDAGAGGARVVVCTCSTIGDMAETMVTHGAFQARRIDRAMADAAARAGPRVLLIAALHSTLAPTTALLLSSAQRMGVEIQVMARVVSGAWAQFEAGDGTGYIASIADAARQWHTDADTVVLAQASMAPAVDLLAAEGIAVLSSPRLGVASALALAGATSAV